MWAGEQQKGKASTERKIRMDCCELFAARRCMTTRGGRKAGRNRVVEVEAEVEAGFFPDVLA
jgi:hypothetical protein